MGCKAETLPKEEGTGDFQTIRAKFQNDSSLLQPTKKPPAKNVTWQSTNSHCTTKAKPLCQRQVPDPEKKTEWSTSQKSETVQGKPVALPRMRLRELSAVGKNEDKKGKDLVRTINAETAPVIDSPKQHPASDHHSTEALVDNSSFRHTLHIWEKTLSRNDQKCSTAPSQCANKTVSSMQVKCDDVNTTEETMKVTGNKQGLVFTASKNSTQPQNEPVPFSTISPPVPPRSHTGLEKRAHEPINSTPNVYDCDMPSKIIQCPNEEQHYVKEVKLPKSKPLPSVESLGPPPKKPPRPPKVDLSTFHQKQLDAVDDVYMTPETPETREENTYEETVSYLQQLEYPSSSNVAQETTHSSKTEKRESLKKYFLPATCSTEAEDELERRELGNNESLSKQQAAKEIFKSGDNGDILVKARTNGRSGVGKSVLPKGTTQTTTEQFLENDRNVSDGYVCLEALKINVEPAVLDPRALGPEQPPEELYDDIDGIDTFSSFTSDSVPDSTYEETYEDIQSEDYKSKKSDKDKVEKLKKFGKLFKKDKFKMKNAQPKQNICKLSSSVPNLDIMTEENMVYDDINPEENDTKEKNEMHKNWKLRFLVSKQKNRRRSNEDADEILSSRNVLKAKKKNAGKQKKMPKEEKLFRENFMYTKEITVINTAVANCSNALTKRKLDLRITAGEQLEIIDITEGNHLICRNSEGMYGYVLLEHLNFSH